MAYSRQYMYLHDLCILLPIYVPRPVHIPPSRAPESSFLRAAHLSFLTRHFEMINILEASGAHRIALPNEQGHSASTMLTQEYHCTQENYRPQRWR